MKSDQIGQARLANVESHWPVLGESGPLFHSTFADLNVRFAAKAAIRLESTKRAANDPKRPLGYGSEGH